MEYKKNNNSIFKTNFKNLIKQCQFSIQYLHHEISWHIGCQRLDFRPVHVVHRTYFRYTSLNPLIYPKSLRFREEKSPDNI